MAEQKQVVLQPTQLITVTLSAQTIMASMNALGELPFKVAQPAIREWEQQLDPVINPKPQAAEAPAAAPAAPAQEKAPVDDVHPALKRILEEEAAAERETARKALEQEKADQP